MKQTLEQAWKDTKQNPISNGFTNQLQRRFQDMEQKPQDEEGFIQLDESDFEENNPMSIGLEDFTIDFGQAFDMEELDWNI